MTLAAPSAGDRTRRVSGSSPQCGPSCTRADKVLEHFQRTAVVPLGKVVNAQNSCECNILNMLSNLFKFNQNGIKYGIKYFLPKQF